MAVGPRRQARATPIQSVREGHLSEGSAPEYPDFVERSRSDSEACARGRTALPDAHFEPAAQVRIRATSRSVVQGHPMITATGSRLSFLLRRQRASHAEN